MSTLMDSVAGKGRNISTNFWIWLLIGSLLVFAGNTLYAATKASRLGGASTAASRLQLNSQRLANQGREAVEGDAQAFDAFKATKTEVDEDIKTLNARFGDQADVSGPIRTVSNTWDPLAKRADEVMASQQAVLALAGRADSFSAKVPQLQAPPQSASTPGMPLSVAACISEVPEATWTSCSLPSKLIKVTNGMSVSRYLVLVKVGFDERRF